MKKLLISSVLLVITIISSLILSSCYIEFDGGTPWTIINSIEDASVIFGKEYLYPDKKNIKRVRAFSDRYQEEYKKKYYKKVKKVLFSYVLDDQYTFITIFKGNEYSKFEYCKRDYDIIDLRIKADRLNIKVRETTNKYLSRYITQEFYYKDLLYQVDTAIPEDEEVTQEKIDYIKEYTRELITQFRFYGEMKK